MSNLTYQQAQRQINRRYRRRLVFRAHVVVFSLALMMGFLWLRAQPIGYPVYLIPPTLWAFLLIGHWFYHSTASTQDKAVEHLWEDVYGARPGDTLMNPDAQPETGHLPSYEQIRRVVETELIREKVKRRRLLFRVNIAAYLVAMLLGWIVIPVIFGPFITESSALTIFALSIGGLAEVILHYMAMRLDTVEGERTLRERLLGRALQQVTEIDDRTTEKAKRTMHLSEDGELLEIIDEQPESKKAMPRLSED